MEFETITNKLKQNREKEEHTESKIDMIATLDLEPKESNKTESGNVSTQTIDVFGNTVNNNVKIRNINRRERVKNTNFTMYPSTKEKLVSMADDDGISASTFIDGLVNAEWAKRNPNK